MKKSSIFLAKSGKIFGPITSIELDRLRLSGEIRNYSWLWDSNAQNAWRPLDPPPPSPLEGSSQHPSTSQKTLKSIMAVCHNARDLMSGQVLDFSLDGCTMEADDFEKSGSPLFASPSRVELNLLHTGNGKSLNVEALVTQITRGPNSWKYQLSWSGSPPIGEFLKA